MIAEFALVLSIFAVNCTSLYHQAPSFHETTDSVPDHLILDSEGAVLVCSELRDSSRIVSESITNAWNFSGQFASSYSRRHPGANTSGFRLSLITL
ncbi:hypothetical protein AB1N83_001070 [Pleurotus pulmonarius]